MNIKTQYDAFASDYIEGQKVFFSGKPDEARAFIKGELGDIQGKVILDVGCGGGVDVVAYEQMGAASVYGIDTSDGMIQEAKKIVQHPELVTAQDSEQTNFPDSTFDAVVARFSFHYLEKFDKAYVEFSRILKPSGKLVIVVQHPMRDFRDKIEKIYGKQEIVTIKLYDDKVSLTFPTHTFSDYFTPQFFTFFQLTAIYENNLDNGKEIPATLGFAAVRK